MKKIITLTFLVSLSLSGFSQAIPNAGFENWVTSGTYTDPASWDTPNQQTTALPFIGAAVVTKSSGGHSGSWCAKLESKNFILYTVPGIMSLGQFNIDLAAQTFSLTGGVPFNQRPEKFKGFYKYTPQGGDSCAMGVVFYKHNPGGGQDTIGLAYFFDNSSVTTWTAFEAPVTWYSSEDPDTMNILVSTCSNTSPAAGSILYTDDFSFDYATDISTLKPEDQLIVKYNRNSKDIIIDCGLAFSGKIVARLINLTGQTVRKEESTIANQGNIKISAEGLPRGIYVVDLQTGNKKMMKKIVIN